MMKILNIALALFLFSSTINAGEYKNAEFLNAIKIDDGAAASGKVWTATDSAGNGGWLTLPPAALANNTLDQAYDEGGAGAGRDIAVDAGGIRMFGANAGDETLKVITSAGGGALFVQNTGTGNSVQVDDVSLDSSPFVIDDDGNVGIKTSTPSQALHITGSFRMVDGNQAAGNVMRSSADGTGVWTAPAGVDGTGTATRGVRWFDTDTIEDSGLIDTSDAVAVTIDGSENVRIGTGAPAHKFDVIGDVNTTTEYKIDSSTITARDANGNLSFGDPSSIFGAGNSSNIVIGDGSTFGGLVSNAILVGNNMVGSEVGGGASIVLGHGARSTAASQFVVGSTTFGMGNMYLGNGVSSATPAAGPFNYTVTGGSGTNIIGTSLGLSGGRATGNAVGGSIIFQTSNPGASGTALQGVSEKLKIAANGTLTINQAYAMPTADGNADEVMSTDGAGVVSFSPELQAANFVAAYDTTTQAISVANTFQTVDFSNNAQLNGWTHTVSTDAFTCNQTGLYLVNLQLHGEKSSGAAATFESRITINNVEIAGSQDGADIIANNESFIVGVQNFLISVTSAQVLRVEAASSTTNYSVTPGPAPGSSTAQIAARLSVVRIN